MKFIELTKERHSVRSYTARPVEQEKLDYILECARLAPSAVNKQPWKFMVVQSPEGKSKICQCYAREWMAEAPLYIIVCAVADEAWTRRYDGKNHADIDAAIATYTSAWLPPTKDWAPAGCATSTRRSSGNFSPSIRTPTPWPSFP